VEDFDKELHGMNLKVREKQQELNLIEYQIRNIGVGYAVTSRARSNMPIMESNVARSQ